MILLLHQKKDNMKYFKLLLTGIISLMLMYSCSDEESTEIENPHDNIDSGRAEIGFTTDTTFGGSSSFNLSNTTTTFAYSSVDSITRIVQIKATENLTNQSREVVLLLVMPANTVSPATITLDSATTSSSYGVMSYRTYQGSVEGPVFKSYSGSVTINSLTNTAVSGTFNANLSDTLSHHISITNGHFDGRF